MRRVAEPQERCAMTAPRLCASTTLNDANCALKCFVHLACHSIRMSIQNLRSEIEKGPITEKPPKALLLLGFHAQR